MSSWSTADRPSTVHHSRRFHHWGAGGSTPSKDIRNKPNAFFSSVFLSLDDLWRRQGCRRTIAISRVFANNALSPRSVAIHLFNAPVDHGRSFYYYYRQHESLYWEAAVRFRPTLQLNPSFAHRAGFFCINTGKFQDRVRTQPPWRLDDKENSRTAWNTQNGLRLETTYLHAVVADHPHHYNGLLLWHRGVGGSIPHGDMTGPHCFCSPSVANHHYDQISLFLWKQRFDSAWGHESLFQNVIDQWQICGARDTVTRSCELNSSSFTLSKSTAEQDHWRFDSAWGYIDGSKSFFE
ncbi:hypothetical protein C8R43DRAFT_1111069 [Mycena crocata]|nr:hypothetical protein C8R43DRAFT_1111069 [Mycena crocata]